MVFVREDQLKMVQVVVQQVQRVELLDRSYLILAVWFLKNLLVAKLE